MHGFVLAILAAICWGLAPVAAKVALNQVPPIYALSLRSALATLMIVTWLSLTGENRMAVPLSSKTVTWILIEALLATVVGDAFYFYALQYGKAVQVGLIMASSPLITIIAASFLLNEPVTLLKLVGALIIVIGLVLISV